MNWIEPSTPTIARVMPAELDTGTASRLRTPLRRGKAHLPQTEHPSSLPTSYCFPGQPQGAVLGVYFTSARPVPPSVRDATGPAI